MTRWVRENIGVMWPVGGIDFRVANSPTIGPLAHRVEQGTFNPKVPGSRPGRPTSKTKEFRVLVVSQFK